MEKLRLLWTQQCFPTGQLGCPQVVPSCVPRFRGSSPQPHRQHCVAAFTRVSEMRIDYGPGYRIYFVRRGKTVVVLLCGGNKQTQSEDIAKAKNLAKELKDGA